MQNEQKNPTPCVFHWSKEKIQANPKGHHGRPRAGQATWPWLTWWIYWGCKGNIGPELSQAKNEPISPEWGNRAFTKWDQWAPQSSPPAYLHSNFRRSSARRVSQEACRLCWGNSLMPAGARAGKRCPGYTEQGQATTGTPGLSALARSRLPVVSYPRIIRNTAGKHSEL